MRHSTPKKFNPNLGVNSKQPEEPIYRFSWWSVVGLLLSLLILSLAMPSPEARALSREALQHQRAFHDHTCEDLHRQTHHLKRVMERYDTALELPEKQRLWSEVTALNDHRNNTIETYRNALIRQAIGGNTPVFAIDKVCRFGIIELKPIQLVTRH